MFDIVNDGKLAAAARKKGFEDVFVMNKDITLISSGNISEFRKLISREKKSGGIIAVLGNDDELNRSVLRMDIDFLLSPENIRRRDFPDYRNSGLNHVLCKEAAEKNIAIAFNFSDILNLQGEDKSLRLGRMMQNVKLCLKFKVPMILATFASAESELRSPDEIISFGISIGMSRIDAEKALNQISKIKQKESRHS